MEEKTHKKTKKRTRYKLREFEIYASFLALPTKERRKVFGFHTDGEFSEKYKVNPSTLSEWKKDDKLWEIRNKYLKEFRKYTANVLKALYVGAMEKKTAGEALAWFKLVEGWKEKEEEQEKPFEIKVIYEKLDNESTKKG